MIGLFIAVGYMVVGLVTGKTLYYFNAGPEPKGSTYTEDEKENDQRQAFLAFLLWPTAWLLLAGYGTYKTFSWIMTGHSKYRKELVRKEREEQRKLAEKEAEKQAEKFNLPMPGSGIVTMPPRSPLRSEKHEDPIEDLKRAKEWLDAQDDRKSSGWGYV